MRPRRAALQPQPPHPRPCAPRGEGGGVRARIGAIVPSHVLVVEPGEPLADDDGLVARPNGDIEGEVVAVMRARRAYEVSLKVIETEDEMMGSLLDNPI